MVRGMSAKQEISLGQEKLHYHANLLHVWYIVLAITYRYTRAKLEVISFRSEVSIKFLLRLATRQSSWNV